jgi:glycosyltransferase involved in cell wall biosynthesis
LADINIYCEVVGGPLNAENDPARRCTGPMVVALNLFLGLLRYTSLDFCFYTLADSVVSHPRIRLLKTIDGAKVHHVLFGLELSEAVASRASGRKVILGPNVLFNLPHGDLRFAELNLDSQQVVRREEALIRSGADLFLFPSLYNPELMQRRLSGVNCAAFPSGIDTELFAPVEGERPFDVAIMAKGRYSDRETYTLAWEQAEKLHQLIKNEYRATMLTEYEHRDYPTLLRQFKLIVNTTPWETQGLAIMEAQSAGVPVIHRSGLPYQPQELALCQCDYSSESFRAAIAPALAERDRLSAISRSHIVNNFSLAAMAQQYQQLVTPLLGD